MERFYLRYCLQVTLGLNRVQDGRSSWDVIPVLIATGASHCASQITALALPRGTPSSVGSPRRITTLANCALTLAYRHKRFQPLPQMLLHLS